MHNTCSCATHIRASVSTLRSLSTIHFKAFSVSTNSGASLKSFTYIFFSFHLLFNFTFLFLLNLLFGAYFFVLIVSAASKLMISFSVEFLEYHPKLFLFPLTQFAMLIKLVPPSSLITYKRSTSRLIYIALGYQPSTQKTLPLLSCQTPLKYANCPSSHLFRQFLPIYYFFVTLPTLKIGFVSEPP